jgi:hypothetical protein
VPEPLPWSEVLISYRTHPTNDIQLPDGRKMPDVIWDVYPAAKERIRAGYMCCNCLGQFLDAWPKKCPDCRYPVADDQAWLIQERMYTDYGIVTPGIPLDREREIMARNAHKPKVQMVVPKSVKR